MLRAQTSGPDLVPTAVTTTIMSVPVGGSFPISYTVINRGTIAADAFLVGLYLSRDATIVWADTLLSSRLVGSLAEGAGARETITVRLPTSVALGTYYIGAIADDTLSQPETDETNNALSGNTINVTSQPAITSLSLTSGFIGTMVTITGANFGAAQGTSILTFNGTAAPPDNWSDTSIVAAVPKGATTGPVVITVGGVASNGPIFTVVERITGTISSASDGTPIGDALIEAVQEGAAKVTATTGSDGVYALTGIAAGRYEVRASATGYRTDVRPQTTVEVGGTTTVNFSLYPSATESIITYMYDALGRLTGVINSAGETVTYTFDAVGNLLSIARKARHQ